MDPGIGFGKTLEHNLEILRSLERFVADGIPVLLGASRKSFLGRLTGREVTGRLAGSLACVARARQAGVRAVRVHDVRESVDLLRVLESTAPPAVTDAAGAACRDRPPAVGCRPRMGAPPAAIVPPLQVVDLVEIGVLWVVLYLFLRFLRRTIAGGMFRGPGMFSWVVLLAFFLVLPALKLEVLAAILAGAFPVFVIALVVIFQPELRHGIARLGQSRFFRGLFGRTGGRAIEIRAVDEVVRAVASFAERRIGALIALERNIDLTTYTDTGVPLDAEIRAETLDTIFSTRTVLHDGAVVIRKGRIAAAGCLFPLTEKPHLARQYGTRHRAAIGLSEQSDATVIVVSEESGQIHLAERGEMQAYRDEEWLTAYLAVVFAETQGLAPPDAGLASAEESA